MFWRRRARSFEVLGRRFELPTLRLGSRLDAAARLRRRLGATWLEALLDPVLRGLRPEERRVRVAFRRSYRVLRAHEVIVYTALEHVAIYDDALARATRHVVERSRAKVDELVSLAAERRRVAERAVHLAARVEGALERDLAIIGERIRSVGRSAHLMMVRLQRYRAFVKRTLAALVHRERQLVAQRTLLVHDEHAFELSRELASDRDITRWMVAPDALCAGIEANLRDLLGDLDGLEGGLLSVPDAVERLLARAGSGELDELTRPLLGLEHDAAVVASAGALTMELPSLSEVPERLDDGDWEALQGHELESQVVFRGQSAEALAVEVEDWLRRHASAGPGPMRPCAGCGGELVSGAALGRSHVLCVDCREEASVGGHAWLERVGFSPTKVAGTFRTPVSRVVFEAVMGWVPSAGAPGGAVTNLTWLEAIELCNALSRREGRRPAYRVRGEEVSLRSGADGWRLLEVTEPARGPLREWRWGTGDGRSPRRLGQGLRAIAAPGRKELDRAVPDLREDDVTVHIACTPPAVAAPVASPVMPPRRTRSPSPIVVRRHEPAAARRAVQAVSLGMLVSGAVVAIAMEDATLQGSGETPSPAATTPDDRPPVAASPAEPRAAPEESPGVAPQPATSTARGDGPGDKGVPGPLDAQLELGYAARAKKDRKAARVAFDRAVVVAPDDLTARYEAAREAAFARDLDQAFLHLGAIKGATQARARQLLLQVPGEVDFARLVRDRRWRPLAEKP